MRLQSLTATPATSPAGQPSGRRRAARPGQWRLATRFTLAVVALAIPLELIVLWSGLSGLRERRAAELQNAVLIAQALAAVVDGFAGDLESTTFSTAIALGAQPGPLNQDTAGEHLRLVAGKHPLLRALFLTDTRGRLVATGTGGALGFDLSTRPYIPPLQAGASTIWSGGIAGVQTGETTVAFGRAVRGPDGATRGFLIAAFYPQQFVQRLPITLPPNADVTVIDDHGVVLYDSSPGDTPTELTDSTSVRAVLGGQIVRITGPVDLGNDDARFGALVPIPRLGWAVGYTLPLGPVESALAWRSWAQAGGIALVILAAAGVFVMIARRLTRPLTMLAETADAISRGEQPSVPEVESATEIQQLALAMRMMSAAVAEREDALRESETRLRLAVEAAPVVLFNHDRQLRYTWVGKAFAGLAPETLIGKTDADLFPPDAAEAAMALKRRALETGERTEGELELPGDAAVETSLPRRWELTAEPLREAGGGVIGITCAALDVTERRALERMQQEFISLVSHELRNPLASVKGYAQLMQRRGEFNERAIHSIVEQSDHLDRLISDLLDSSRAEAGRLELRRRRVNLVDVVNASIERVQTQTERHRIRLESRDDELYGLWDLQRLNQVFSNLLVNAMKYSPDGGEIVVRLERQGDDAHVAIQDQGVGIEHDQLPRIFDRFYRVTGTAPSIQGLGIGLYVAKELIEAHGGRIWAESAGPGRGTTLHVLLALDARTPPGLTSARPVLVVDDDESLRALIVDTLRDEGYRLAIARDGLEALERVAADPPGLILLDWMMPRLNGEGFATELRQRHPTLDVPIIVMTAGGVAHERAASIGAHGFLNKPFELAVLLDQVARHLGPRAAPPG